MNLLSDIITYVRRIIKSPSNAQISDNLIIDYINRFWIMDVDARMQLFDLKTKYSFQTIPGINQYNMPLYDVQTEPGSQDIGMFPVYQGFTQPTYVNGIQVPFYTQRQAFLNLYPNYVQVLNPVAYGDGVTTNFTLTLPFFPAIPGHIDMTGIIASGVNVDPPFVTTPAVNGSGFNVIPSTSVFPGVWITSIDQSGNKIVVTDSGQFLSGDTGSILYGLLIAPGNPPNGDAPLTGGYSTTINTVNYATGSVNVTFPTAPASGAAIQVQSFFIEQGLPRAALFYNNSISVLPPPNISYLVEFDAYLSPAAFLNTGSAIPFGYMAEYIARGAARKILSDTGDAEQLAFYEPLFREQEMLVWKRSQRQFTATRTGTIFSELQGPSNFNTGQGGT